MAPPEIFPSSATHIVSLEATSLYLFLFSFSNKDPSIFPQSIILKEE